jgi:plastocyanin domain-containing protein
MRTLVIALAAAFVLTACKKEEPAAAPKPAPAPAAAPAAPTPAPAPEAAAPAGPRVIAMEVTGDGFVPANITVKAGEPVKFVVTRKTDETCALDLLIEGTDIKAPLPLNQAVEVAWTPTKAGKVKFGCAMDMMIGGMLVVE